MFLTNLSSDEEIGTFDAREILTLYKEQYGIEQNFGFLKNPATINGIFFERPGLSGLSGGPSTFLIFFMVVAVKIEDVFRHK